MRKTTSKYMDAAEKRIYADYAASTPLDSAVLKVMMPWLTEKYANPSATHADGQVARVAIDDARRSIASTIGAQWHEVSFMHSGTESINTALLGIARAERRKQGVPVHVITTAIEHHAVLDACKQLEREGDSVTVVPVEANGIVSVDAIVMALQENTVLVSTMMVNNEIGTVQPVAQIAHAVKALRPDVLVHTDACQAGNYFEINVAKLGVDLLSLNGSKIYGPKGSAFLYVRSGVKPEPLLFGGGQEFELQPGTENVAAIVGLAHALQLAQQSQVQKTEAERMSALRNQFVERIQSEVSNAELNGDAVLRSPNNANIFFPDIDGDIFLFELSVHGVSASLGSACTAGSIEPSHVVIAIGRNANDARKSIRFTFGRNTTQEEIDDLVRIIAEIQKKGSIAK